MDAKKMALILSLLNSDSYTDGDKSKHSPEQMKNDQMVQQLLQQQWQAENPGQQPQEVLPPTAPINNSFTPDPNDPGFRNSMPLDASQMEVAPPSKGNFVDESGKPIDPDTMMKLKLLLGMMGKK